MDEQRKDNLSAEADGIIEGRNAVIGALRAGSVIDKIYLQKGETDKTLGHIASKARAAGVVVVEADRRKLDAMSRTHAHQGVIALAAVREYVSVESMLAAAAEKGENPLLVVCDEISDPHNPVSYTHLAQLRGDHRHDDRPEPSADAHHLCHAGGDAGGGEGDRRTLPAVLCQSAGGHRCRERLY